VPSSSAHAFRALHQAGAVLLGKSNLCDLAFSAESDNHIRGPVRNPHDLSRSAGGSTGGGAAAVADGMAAFDWGTDFGGSIRGPAAFCGVAGLRLSSATWPVGFEHFPRIAPFFWDLCGMGPLARDVALLGRIVEAVRPALREANAADVDMDGTNVVLYGPDRDHLGAWSSFDEEARRLLAAAGVRVTHTELPSPSEVNALYTEHLAANFDEMMRAGDLPMREGLPAVLLALATGGRLDKRVHPNTAMLLAGVFVLGFRYRDRKRAAVGLAALRAQMKRVWAEGKLVVSPACTYAAPRHGKSALMTRLMSFCKLGNLTDATAVAIPWGAFADSKMPRALQILGPPGSERAVLDLASRLEERIGRAKRDRAV
jgi:Asp-tRNA(Asn)/Glu-tRNA(Gln) amidotransferase A subunit family amidase